ncbi:MFS family permease [Kitasatospora sp. MAA4]|uniref:MFS transporter n=1 Tax=Kitasatospora sp. MAA4 TaxID=3035093 RepID=UPI0024763FD1|nr:MFS transporter [Kitasatospora sp. MAA4]MDH6132386.1 MFS family permease [Kitasatospora sp. MAA4]
MGIARTSVLRDRNFLLLWGGNGISLMGTYGARIAYPILALEVSGSPVTAGWVSFASSGPSLLFYVHAGIVADYADRRRTMLCCQLVGAATSATLALWILVGAADLPEVLVAVALCEGVLFAYFSLAEVAAIRDLVPRAQYGLAFSLYEAEQPAAILVGRVLAAALLELARWIPFAGNFLSYLLSLGTITALRGDFGPVAARSATGAESFRSRAREGFSWIRQSRFVAVSTVATGATNALFQVTILLLMVESRQEGRPEWVVGIILASAGAGGVVGAALAPRITRSFAPRRVFVAGLWLWAATLLPMALTANPVVLTLSWCGVGAVGTVVSVVNTLGRIGAVPPDALGRLVGLVSLITSGAVPLGAALGGYVIACWGVRATAWALPAVVVVLAAGSGLVLRRSTAG